MGLTGGDAAGKHVTDTRRGVFNDSGPMTVAENTAGYREIPPEDRKKAEVFFARGRTVADTGNYDYGIEMFINGLELDPDSVEAHKELREISLKRRAAGHKPLGMLAALKLKPTGKDDKRDMLNAEKLLSYDPGNTDHMLRVLEAAYKGGFYDTVLWIGPILHKANAEIPSGKPDYNKFIKLKNVYRSIAMEPATPQAVKARLWRMATDAVYEAARLRPDDMDLQSELKNLAAQQTMTEGNYESGESFRSSIRDFDKQQKLLEEEKDVRSEDYLTRSVREAREQYQANPQDSANISRYVDALLKTETKENDAEAMRVLKEAYERTGQFRYRHRYGQIHLRGLVREQRILDAQLKANPKNEELLTQRRMYVQYRLEEELTEYKLWSENYPTDLTLKFEVAKRMFALGHYDEAIPALQQSRQDPKVRDEASVLLARAFLEAGFSDEAVDTLRVLIEQYQVRDDAKSKEMFYWYGVANQAKGDRDAALKAFSQVAQWDFTYRDVQERIKKLRAAASA